MEVGWEVPLRRGLFDEVRDGKGYDMTMTHHANPSTPATPRWKEIYDELLKLLPGYSYGSNFFTIAEICEKYDVSHITGRRVLTELEQQGLVEKIRKRGTVVRRQDQKAAAYLVIPSHARSDYASYNLLMRRMVGSLTVAAQEHNVEFEIIQEAYVESIFKRKKGNVGFILPSLISEQSLEFFGRKQLPYVLMTPGDHWEGHPHVRNHTFSIGYDATTYLLNKGHRRIAYVLGPLSQRHFRDRIKGYKAALRAAKVPFKWELVRETIPREPVSPECDFDTFEVLMAMRHPPTAVITGDKGRAMRLLNFCQQRGIAVPGQLSILCFPDFPEAKLTDPPLSAMDGQYLKMGQLIIKMLLEQLYEKAAPEKQAFVLEPVLIERESVATLQEDAVDEQKPGRVKKKKKASR